MRSSRRTTVRLAEQSGRRGGCARLVAPAESALLAAAERARQAFQHHRVQADAGLSHRVRAVRGVSARLFRLEHAPPDHRADHRHGQRRNHRPVGAIQRRAASGGWSLSSTRGRAGPARASISSRPSPAMALAGNVGCSARACSNTSGLDRNGLSPSRRAPKAPEHHALVRVFELPSGFRLLVGRDLEERERLYRHHPRCRTMVDRAGDRAWACRRIFRRAPRAAPRRRHDRNLAHHHGRRSGRPAAGRRHRRRTRPARGQPQRHAGADRGADARPQGGLRQHRPRSQDAADAACATAPRRRCGRPRAKPTTARRWKRRSRNPTS